MSPQIFSFQVKLGRECISFRLAQLWAVIRLTLSMRLLQAGSLIKLIGLLLTTMASQNGIHSALILAEKGKFGASTLSHKMCPRKQTTGPKWLILVSFLSGEDNSSTYISYGIHILQKVCRSVLLRHPIACDIKFG